MVSLNRRCRAPASSSVARAKIKKNMSNYWGGRFLHSHSSLASSSRSRPFAHFQSPNRSASLSSLLWRQVGHSACLLPLLCWSQLTTYFLSHPSHRGCTPPSVLTLCQNGTKWQLLCVNRERIALLIFCIYTAMLSLRQTSITNVGHQ